MMTMMTGFLTNLPRSKPLPPPAFEDMQPEASRAIVSKTAANLFFIPLHISGLCSVFKIVAAIPAITDTPKTSGVKSNSPYRRLLDLAHTLQSGFDRMTLE